MASNPTASGVTVTKTVGESTPLTSLFSYADRDNDIVKFAVKDREIGGGYLTKNGERQTENALFDNIPISQIEQWAFVAGPAGSTSTIGFNAIDSRNQFNPSVTSTVKVAAEPDTTGPKITSVTPTMGATGVAGNSNIAVKLNENVMAGSFVTSGSPPPIYCLLTRR